MLFASGRMDPTKGCHTLLRAYREAGLEAPLLVVGASGHAPAYDAHLRQVAAGLPVRFEANVPQPLLYGLLRRARLFVFPSSVEGMSILLLEALEAGAPGIVSDIPENLVPLPPGWPSFRTGDAADLARRLGELWALDDAELRSLGKSGRAWVDVHFSWDEIAAHYLDVLRRAQRRARL